MAASPAFIAVPRLAAASLSTGMTGLTTSGSTGLTALITAASTGTRINRIEIKASGTTTAGMVRLWKYSGSGNAELWREVPVSAITASASVAAFFAALDLEHEILPSGWQILASTHNSEAFTVFALGGDL